MEIQAKIMERVESNRGRQIGIDPKKKAIALVVWFVVLIGLMVSCSMVQNAQRKPLTSLISTQNIVDVLFCIHLRDGSYRHYTLSDEEIEDFKKMLERTSYVSDCDNNFKYNDSWSALIKDWEYKISYDGKPYSGSITREFYVNTIFDPCVDSCKRRVHKVVLVSGFGDVNAHKPPKSLGSSWDSIDPDKLPGYGVILPA
ncbi:MAG: hypothetical protein IJD07_03475 [Clostridia bacterium]|nr:hypothetical protein [Clostridia bacterium]